MEKALLELLNLQGKVAIITGGAQGVGLAIVETLSAAGAQVVVADVNHADLRHFGQQMGVDSLEVVAGEFAKRIPLGRWTEPEDVGRAVWFLSGRAADYITGQVIYVDGGMTLGL